jgi:hypothetical protein
MREWAGCGSFAGISSNSLGIFEVAAEIGPGLRESETFEPRILPEWYTAFKYPFAIITYLTMEPF